MKQPSSPQKPERRARADAGMQRALADADKRLYYSKPCLLPVLLLDVFVHERSREESSEADLMLLRCIGLGLRSTRSLARVMGIDVGPQLEQARGQSLVEGDDGSWRLSEVGDSCLRHGMPVRRVRRALRLCAISGRLLPRGAYELPITLPLEDDLKAPPGTAFIAEPESVALAALKSGWQHDKRRYNLADETLQIETVERYRPALQHASLAIVGEDAAEEGWVFFGRDHDAYPLEQVVPLLEAFNPGRTIQEEGRSWGVAQLLLHGLAKRRQAPEGQATTHVLDGELTNDARGLPLLRLGRVSDEWLRSPLAGGVSAALCCATERTPGRALTQIPGVSPKALDGHALTILITDAELGACLDRYKLADARMHVVRGGRAAAPVGDAQRQALAEHFGSLEWPLVERAIRRFGTAKQVEDWCGRPPATSAAPDRDAPAPDETGDEGGG